MVSQDIMEKNLLQSFQNLITGEQQLIMIRGNKHEFRCAQWLSATVGQKYSDFSMDENEKSIILRYTYDLPTVPSTKVNVSYYIEEDGVIKVTVGL